MDKNGLVIVLFVLIVIVFGQSDAFNSRTLVTISDPNGSDNVNQDSPPPPEKTGDLSAVGAPKPKDKPNINPSDLEPKGVNDTHTKKGSENASDKKLDTGKNLDGNGLKAFPSESCKKNLICNDQGKTMMACVQDFKNGSTNLTLVVQNEQDADLKVNITFGSPMNMYLRTFELPAHVTKKFNMTFPGDKNNKVILNAGNGDCALQISQLSQVNGVNNPADTPEKPKAVIDPADTPAKPKDINNSTDSPIKPDNTPPKSKDVNTPPKSKDVDNQPKSKDADDQSKAKDVDDPSKSKEADNSTKSKEVDDPSKTTPTSFNAPVSKNNVFDQLTFYSKQVTPIHGAYLAFLVALVIGGSWALCSFRKRRTVGGVPYQELEMGPAEPSNAVDVETAEGWEQDWDDDDWDEDKAIRSPGGSSSLAKTISSNGLTSRAVKKDGWDADWDD